MKRYQVKGKIGTGGLGDVYLAEDTRLGREVALKRVRMPEGGNPAAVEADLLREARTLSALQHPNIVTIYDAGSDEEGPFVIMEYLKGETLDQVASRGALKVEDFREVVLQTLEGMIAAQSLGLVHRDLKPSNLMVVWLASGKFQVKILDFGLAKFSQTAVPQTEDQESGIMGSIFFMAPEQFERLPLDARTDMYSLGCIYYQILTMRYAFDGRTGPEVMASHLQHHVTPVRELRKDLPEWMADWVMWLISRDMEDRPPDARTALDYFLAGRSGLQKPPAPSPTSTAPPAVRIVGRGSGPAGVTVTRPAPGVPVAPAARPAGTKKAGTRKVSGSGGGGRKPGTTSRISRPAARRVRRSSARGTGPGLWIALTLVLVLAAGGAVWYLRQDRKPQESDQQILETLVAAPAPLATPATIELLHGFIERGGGDAVRAANVLRKLKGPETGKAIARALEVADGISRTILMEAVTANPDREGIAALISLAASQPGNVRLTALDALEKVARPADAPALLAILPKIRDDSGRSRFLRMVHTVLGRESDPSARVKPLSAALDSADADVRPEILRLLGRTGAPEAVTVLARELAAGGQRGTAALDAAAAWPVPTPALAEALLKSAGSGQGDPDTALRTFAATAARITGWNAQEITENLRNAMPLAKSANAREAVLAALGTIASPASAQLARELSASTDATVATAASRALQEIELLIPRILKAGDTELTLHAGHARIAGPSQDAYYSSTTQYITNWKHPGTTLSWDVDVSEPGAFAVSVLQSTTSRVPRTFRVRFGEDTSENAVRPTETSGQFEAVEAGHFHVPRPGIWRLWIEVATPDPGQPLMNVREVVLVPG